MLTISTDFKAGSARSRIFMIAWRTIVLADLAAILSMAMSFCVAGGAAAADLPIPTKAMPVAATPAICGSVYDFFFTSCPLDLVRRDRLRHG
jgi:hypothetical protein